MARRPSGRPADGEAVFRSIADSLQARITAREIPRGKRMPSQRRLAKEFNVSKRTIERALEVLTEEGHCSRRGKGQLVAERADSGISLDSHLIMEVLSSPLRDLTGYTAYQRFQRGIEKGLAERCAPLLLVHDGHLRNHLPPRLLDQSVRGIILFGRFQLKILKRYAALRIPVILCDLPPGGQNLGSLTVENEAAAYDATKRLLRMGHRRIAFQRFLQMNLRDVDWDAKERQRGYEAALREAKIKPRTSWIFNSLPKEPTPAKWMDRLLSVSPPITALIANNPKTAENFRVYANSRGRHVPRDLSIVCFQEDQPDYPNLTGPRIDFFQMGHRAVTKIFEADAAQNAERLPTAWATGRTMGPPLDLLDSKRQKHRT